MSKLLFEQDTHKISNYMRATGLKVGLLINFSHYPGVEHERFVL
jgi:hypothetical protein